MNRKSTFLFFVSLAALIFVHAFVEFEGNNAVSRPGDAEIYFKMAENPCQFISAPESYRIIVPLLVHISGLPTGLGFLLINSLLLYITIVAYYLYLRGFEFKQRKAMEGAGVLISSFLFWYAIHNYCLVDSLTYLSLLICFIAIQRKLHVLYWASLLVGALNKEVVIFTIPLYWLHCHGSTLCNKQSRFKKVALPLVLSIVSALPVFIIPKFYLKWILGPAFAPQSHISMPTIIKIVHERIITPTFLHNVFHVFSIYWVFVAFNIIACKQNRRCLLNSLPFLLLVISLLFVATDTARMLIYMFPILGPISVNGVSPIDFYHHLSSKGIRLLSVSLALALLLPRFQYFLFFRYPFTYIVEGVLVLITLLLCVHLWKNRTTLQALCAEDIEEYV